MKRDLNQQFYKRPQPGRAQRRAGMRGKPLNRAPDLSGAIDLSLAGKTARASVPPAVIVRDLDERGLMDVPLAQTPQGPQPVMRRDQYLSAEELKAEIVEAVRLVVREELARLGFDDPVADGPGGPLVDKEPIPRGARVVDIPHIVSHVPEQRVRTGPRVVDSEGELEPAQ